VEAEVVKFLWQQKRKHFEETSWKQKQTRKRLTLYGAGSDSKIYSTASTFLMYALYFVFHFCTSTAQIFSFYQQNVKIFLKLRHRQRG